MFLIFLILANYKTNFYTALTGYFYNTFPNVPIYRATYTQSVNSFETTALFSQIPNEDDFNDQFSNLNNRFIMGFCFKNCYNYRQNAIYISPNFTQQPVNINKYNIKLMNINTNFKIFKAKLLDAIKDAWTQSNQINSTLINTVQIKISYLSNDSFLHDQKYFV